MLLNLITCIAVIYAHNLDGWWIFAAVFVWFMGQSKARKQYERIEYIHKIVTETVKARTGQGAP